MASKNIRYLKVLAVMLSISLLGYIIFLLIPEPYLERDYPYAFHVMFGVVVLAGAPLVLATISLAFDVFKAWGGVYCMDYLVCVSTLNQIAPILVYVGLYGLIWNFYRLLQGKA
ncbi:hypothetical protein F0223_16995 [Vibrio coralliilyticus]|uniref:hypothetical protein n=1 Tax=Vibrio TaxID=662 RepID=UPI00050199C5|nr:MULTISPECIES: hypothetical protein [Vibrio]KFI10831.1 hypothetical protein IX95_18485 [Vibrio sp. B183]NOI19922.1 hypothetical protein [Vibrio coralliilyticus]